MLINFNTIEEKIFFKKEIQKQMPEFEDIFAQWNQSVRSPVFNNVRQKAKLKLLELLDHNHIKILEEHYGEKIFLKEINYSISKNVSCKIDDLEYLLMDYDDFADNIVLARNKDNIRISFWR